MGRHREDGRYDPDDLAEVLELVGIGFLILSNRINQLEERTMNTLDDVSAKLDAQKASLDNLTTLEAAEESGGVQPGQVVVEQATIDAVSAKVDANQAEIDALIAADQTPQPTPEPEPQPVDGDGNPVPTPDEPAPPVDADGNPVV